MQREVGKHALIQQLLALGVKPGAVLLVHTAFSQVGPVEGGPRGLIEALREALGPVGTLVMPSMTDGDEVPFDLNATPCRGMGVVADRFWRLAGVRRSDSPHAFAAAGPRAGEITAPHPIEVPHGPDSPAGRVHALNGQVLLLGVGHDANTTIHLGEFMAGVRYRRAKRLAVLRDGRPSWLEYEEIDHCCRNFVLVEDWLDERGLQRRGSVGYGDARLARARDVVRVVVEHLRQDETAFLHPFGVDEECDEAWTSLCS